MATKPVVVPFPNPLKTAPFMKALRRLWQIARMRLTHGSSAPERALAIEERVTIGPKKSLLVVRCHGQRFLVGVAADTVGPFLEVEASSSSPAMAPAGKSRARSATRRRIRSGRIS